jgi:dCTP deaminase
MGGSRGTAPASLFPEAARPKPRKAGILPSQDIGELIRNGKILSTKEISGDQIQPASIDLRLGTVAHRVQASFLPGGSTTIGTKIKDLKTGELDLTAPAKLDVNSVYIIPIVEGMALPRDISGKANPKSTTGRLDIFTRLMTDVGAEFDKVNEGYSGNLYVEVVTRTFPIVIRAGAKLNQLRFVRGASEFDDEDLQRIAQRHPLVYCENGDGPAKPVIRGGLQITLDLRGTEKETVVAYKAKRNCPPIDLSGVGAHEAERYWQAIPAPRSRRLVLDPSDFYLLASTERVGVPPNCAAEMEQYDPSIGEFSVHYAGFFDPGFGFGTSGEIRGTKAVLEVRAHELPVLLEDGQTVGRVIYHRMADTPDRVYGQSIGSSYQQQGLALSKQFKTSSSRAEAAATKS